MSTCQKGGNIWSGKKEQHLRENYENHCKEKCENNEDNLKNWDIDRNVSEENDQPEIKSEMKWWDWWNQTPNELQDSPNDFPDLVKMEDIYGEFDSEKIDETKCGGFERKYLAPPEGISGNRKKTTHPKKCISKDSSQSKKYNCLICCYKLESKRDFERHMALHIDPLNINLLKCAFCDHKEESAHGLRVHMLIHSGSVREHMLTYRNLITSTHPSNIECGSGKDFFGPSTSHKNSSNLDPSYSDSHDYNPKRSGDFILHSSNETVECCICNDKCNDKSELAKHFLAHRDSSNPSLFKCFLCNYTTNYLGDLRSHSLEHESLKLPKPECERDSESCHDEPSTNPLNFKRYTAFSEEKLCECKICGSKFVSDVALQMHNLLHPDSRHRPVFYCETCDFKTVYSTGMKMHKLEHQNASGPKFKCNFCDSEEDSKSKLKAHVEICQEKFRKKKSGEKRSKTKLYKCDQCTYQGNNPYKLKYHKEVHKLRCKRRLFECSVCGSTYASKAYLQTHCLLHMDPKHRPMQCCDKCDYKTIYKSSLNTHKARHLLPPELALRCSVCHLQARSVNQLKIHTKTVHPKRNSRSRSQIVWYKCSRCSYQANHSRTIRLHEETHKKRSERELYECGTCGSKCTTKNTLRKHMLLHVDAKDRPTFQCDECDYKTMYKSCLRTHKLKHVTLACIYCQWETVNRSELKFHLKVVHKKFPERRVGVKSKVKPRNVSSKQYECDECTFKTGFSNRFNRHKETHKDRSQRKLFVCETCGSSYTSRDALQTHIFLHMDPKDRPTYDCEVCDYKTIYRSRMKVHRLMHADRSKLVTETSSEGDLIVHVETVRTKSLVLSRGFSSACKNI